MRYLILLSLVLFFSSSCGSKNKNANDSTAAESTDESTKSETSDEGSSIATTSSNAGFINHNKENVALDGYDVVAYFKNHEAGNKTKGTKGSASFASKYKEVNYYFSSQENKALFEANPEDYIPAYGGWCAWAMAEGTSRVTVNFDSFLIAQDAYGTNRLYLFYTSFFSNTRDDWLKGNHTELVKKADITWAKEVQKQLVKEQGAS